MRKTELDPVNWEPMEWDESDWDYDPPSQWKPLILVVIMAMLPFSTAI